MRKIDKIFQCGETLQVDDLNEMIDQINEIIEYISTHPGSRPDPDVPDNPVVEETVKSFNTIIQEFNDLGIYSPSIQNSGTTSQVYSYLNSMYSKAKEEYEGNSELFKSSTYSNLEIYNYHGNNNQYELDGTAENAMLYWIVATCLAELIPTSGSNNKQTRLFKFAYDIGRESGYGRTIRLYNNYTPKGDPIICRLVASVIYAKYRRNYRNYISSFRSKIGGSTIPVISTNGSQVWADSLQLTRGNKGSSPINYGYTVDLDSIFPAAAGPYLSNYSSRTKPEDQQGTDKDDFDTTADFVDNYVIDTTIYNTAVNNYNIKTKQNFNRSVQAVADDQESLEQIIGNITYYTCDDSNPLDTFQKTSGGNKYFKGTFNADVIGKDLSGYINTSDFTKILEYTREAAGKNRYTTLDPQYGRRRPSQGTTDPSSKEFPYCYMYDASIELMFNNGGVYWDQNSNKAWKDVNNNGVKDSNEIGSETPPSNFIFANTYPSGHSSEMWGEAMMMIELFPSRYIDIFKAAYAYTVSRTIVRAHWNTDIIFGKLGAATIVPVLHAMSNFDTVYSNAESALNNSPSSGPSITINNNTGTSAKITGEVYIITTQGMIYGYIESINGTIVNSAHNNVNYTAYTIPAGGSITAQLYIENLYNIPIGASLSFNESSEVNSPIRVYGVNSSNERSKSTFVCSDPTQTTYGNFNYIINLTSGSQHIIDIAYTSDFSTSPRLSGYKGTTFNQPTLYIKENNTIYVNIDGHSTYSKYPYWNQLQTYLQYRFEQNTDSSYATINQNTGSVVLNNVTTGDGVRVGVYTQQNSVFNAVDSHFYISISEGEQEPFNIIIDNQLGETTYITGEIYFFVQASDPAAVVYSYTQENILIDPTGDSGNNCKITLPPGESTFSIVRFETPPGTDYREGIPLRTNTSNGITENKVRVYGYGKSGSATKYNSNSDHLKFAFTATVDKSSFAYSNTTYRITLTGKGIQYNDVWKASSGNYDLPEEEKYIWASYADPNGDGTPGPFTFYYNLNNPTQLPKLGIVYSYGINSSYYTLEITSSDTSVAVVSSSTAKVTPLRNGTTIIRAVVVCNDPTIEIKYDDGEITNQYTQYTLVIGSSDVRPDNDDSDPLYTVGLLSDIHYQVNNNKQISTTANGNDSEGSSFFRQDLNKMITRFKESGVKFITSCGDIATSDVNDLVEFTHDYIYDCTGINTYSGTNFLNNSNYIPFYGVIGNHDHFIVYSNANYCKYIDYGQSDHNGSRWKSITYNGTTYNCPEQLAGSGMVYASNNSKSYYIIPSGYPNDMFIFLSAFYGDMLPTSSNPNYDTNHTGNKNDMSQFHPHNQLDSTNQSVIAMAQYCNKSNIFTSGNETNMNFQYYKPSDLIWLKGLIEANYSTKRIFIFSHYFFPQKAGGGNKYEYGSNEMMGLTFHFLNKLNNDYPKTIWFSGHSHFSWKDTTFSGEIHYCNKDYSYIDPNTNANGTSDNQQILSNFVGANWYRQPSGTRYYDRESSPTVTDNATGWNIHLPSMSRPKESSSVNANCEGAILEIYRNHVEIYKIGYSTSDGVNYTSYSNNLYSRSLIINTSDGSGTIDGTAPVTPVSGDIPISVNNSTNDIRIRIINGMDEDAWFNGKLSVYVQPNSTSAINGGDNNGIDLQLIEPKGGGNSAWIDKNTPEQTVINNGGGTTYLMKYSNGSYVPGSTSNKNGAYVINNFKLAPNQYIEKVIPSNYNGYYFCTKGNSAFENSVIAGTYDSGNPAIKLASTNYNRFTENGSYRKITDSEIEQYKNKTKTTGEYYVWDNKYWPVDTGGTLLLVDPIKNSDGSPVQLQTGKTYYAVISKYNNYLINTAMYRISHNEIVPSYQLNQGYTVYNYS